MSEWKDFTRFVQAKAGESPSICGIGAGNSMAFLKFDEQDILQNSGKVSHEVAVAEKEHGSFRVEQDKRFESDIDKMVKKIFI